MPLAVCLFVCLFAAGVQLNNAFLMLAAIAYILSEG